jgi:hypothetical protein
LKPLSEIVSSHLSSIYILNSIYLLMALKAAFRLNEDFTAIKDFTVKYPSFLLSLWFIEIECFIECFYIIWIHIKVSMERVFLSPYMTLLFYPSLIWLYSLLSYSLLSYSADNIQLIIFTVNLSGVGFIHPQPKVAFNLNRIETTQGLINWLKIKHYILLNSEINGNSEFELLCGWKKFHMGEFIYMEESI